ncbi:hypothetical protein [Streptomyces cyanogenus]|uniref:hypothetical protein n=1 Tax=Streptomyces cyanogenus TaxID=80860 RepID=UPI001AA17787|nr:hypothetical protein [Streptomyces cyanogenus]
MRASTYSCVKRQLLEMIRTLDPDASMPAERSLAVVSCTSRTAEGEPVDRVRSVHRGARCKFVAALTRVAG